MLSGLPVPFGLKIWQQRSSGRCTGLGQHRAWLQALTMLENQLMDQSLPTHPAHRAKRLSTTGVGQYQSLEVGVTQNRVPMWFVTD